MPTRLCRRLGKWTKVCLLRMLKGIATRNYSACAETVPEAFGLSRSSVSRRYIKGTARKLAEFQGRLLKEYDLVALFLDGKSCADEEIIIALGVTLDGTKVPLGFVQAATENERVCRRFLADLVERGLRFESGLLVVLDGAKGGHGAAGHPASSPQSQRPQTPADAQASHTGRARYQATRNDGLKHPPEPVLHFN